MDQHAVHNKHIGPPAEVSKVHNIYYKIGGPEFEQSGCSKRFKFGARRALGGPKMAFSTNIHNQGPNAYMNIDLDVLDIYEHRPGVQFDSMKEISDVEALDL